MKIQLWSYNYDPEPTGIGPVSRVLVEELTARGYELEVVAAHPHYPEPLWGTKRFPYRETRSTVPVLRLPLWVGRGSAAQRYRQELTFMAAQFMALPRLPKPDVLISTSPSFPALLPAIINSRARKIPWLLWLHDILPDGAAATGIVDRGSPVIRIAQRLERAAYETAGRIVVLSHAFTENLVAKGVPPGKIDVIYVPATRTPREMPSLSPAGKPSPSRVLSMGNIGHTQGLDLLIRSFEEGDALKDVEVHLVIAGSGVAMHTVRAEIRSDRVEMLGVVDSNRLERELQSATVALVSQRYGGGEFNIPSKIMNFMAYGLPVLAVVDPRSEAARLVTQAGAGWVLDSSQPEGLPDLVAEILRSPDEIAVRGRAAYEFAQREFMRANFADRFEDALQRVVGAG